MKRQTASRRIERPVRRGRWANASLVGRSRQFHSIPEQQYRGPSTVAYEDNLNDARASSPASSQNRQLSLGSIPKKQHVEAVEATGRIVEKFKELYPGKSRGTNHTGNDVWKGRYPMKTGSILGKYIPDNVGVFDQPVGPPQYRCVDESEPFVATLFELREPRFLGGIRPEFEMS